MTDIQMFVLLPLSMLLYSNSKITDTKETLRAEIAAAKYALQLEIQEMRAEMNAGIARIETALKIHELEHHK